MRSRTMHYYSRHWLAVLFFFFQAEDGIRDWSVTGVQTCALPISARRTRPTGPPAGRRGRSRPCRRPCRAPRSEERRVGKECRSWWAPDHVKKKRNRRMGGADGKKGITLRSDKEVEDKSYQVTGDG